MDDDAVAPTRDQLQAEVERLEHEREALLRGPTHGGPRQVIEELRHNRDELTHRLARLRQGAGAAQPQRGS